LPTELKGKRAQRRVFFAYAPRKRASDKVPDHQKPLDLSSLPHNFFGIPIRPFIDFSMMWPRLNAPDPLL
jgi:hypothetical protein